jgi:hypothetical protein
MGGGAIALSNKHTDHVTIGEAPKAHLAFMTDALAASLSGQCRRLGGGVINLVRRLK